MAQVLEAPVLEPVLDELDVVDELVEGDDEELEELSLELAVDEVALSLFFAPPPELLYRSAYQPPPLRMKPAPPET